MNNAKHPKFTKDLNNPALHDADCPVSEVILETFAAAGFETAEPIYTVDGDRVRILAIDCQHQFPIVGEVLDFGAETTWLGRWTASGVYASSERAAVRKHSLKPNAEVGALFRDPGLPELTITIADYLRKGSPRYGSDEVEERAVDFDRRAHMNIVLRPQPQLDRGGSGGRVRDAGDAEYDAAFAEAMKRDEAVKFAEKDAEDHKIVDAARGWRVDMSPAGAWVADERWIPGGLKVNPNGTPAHLDPTNVRARQPALAVNAQLIANAQRLSLDWTRRHRADRSLRTETAKHLDPAVLHDFYTRACIHGAISHNAHLWCMAAVYAIAGRVRFDGVYDVDSSQLEEALDFCRRYDDHRLSYLVKSRRTEAA